MGGISALTRGAKAKWCDGWIDIFNLGLGWTMLVKDVDIPRGREVPCVKVPAFYEVPAMDDSGNVLAPSGTGAEIVQGAAHWHEPLPRSGDFDQGGAEKRSVTFDFLATGDQDYAYS
jgi:hypothetical protein